MPGTRCTVAVCNNSFEKTKRAGMSVMYHQFPKTQPLRNIWISKCNRAGNWNPDSCHICSVHFTENDYKQDLCMMAFNVPGKRRLKATAIPSLFLHEAPPLTLQSRAIKKKKKYSDDEKDNSVYSHVKNENDTQNCVGCISAVPKTVNNALVESITPIIECNFVEPMKMDDVKDEFSPYSKLEYISVVDSSTQTDPDYFLKAYEDLMDRNETLQKEKTIWYIRYKKLASHVKFLESKIRKLRQYSSQ